MNPRVPTTRARSVLIAALATTALTLGVSACGDDSDDTSAEETTAAAPEEVTVTATEYEFALSETPGAETKSVVFQNDGKEFHVMVFAKINEGFTVDEAIELEGEKGSAETIGQTEAEPGATETVEVKQPLEAGSYAILCPLRTKDGEAHYDLGQLQEFDLE